MKRVLAFIVVVALGFQLSAQVVFTLSSSPGVGGFPAMVIPVDLNGDGKIDLVTANQNSDSLSILTNNGSGGFVLASSPMVGHVPRWVVAADVNGDGKVDLISANFGTGQGNTLSVLTNNGSGGFVLASSPTVTAAPYSVSAVDVNGDGKVDLISANSDNTLSVLTNNGSGGFVLASSPNLSGNPRSATPFTNVDGRVDFVSANQQNDSLSIMTNSGGGGFGLATQLMGPNQPTQVTTADVNGDGKVDLISANYGNGTLSVYTNNGSGGFVLSSTPTVGAGAFFVTAADVNGDGKVDLICANYASGNTVSVLTNNGTGGFVTAATLQVGNGPLAVAATDVNGDGKLDIVSANSADDTVSVLLNNTFYPVSPQIATGTAQLSFAYVVNVTVVNGGYDYTNIPVVRLVGGGGSGASAVAVVSNGVVTAINMTSTGSGYTNAPRVFVDPPYISNPLLQISPVTFLLFSNLTTGITYQLQQLTSWYWTNLPVSFMATNATYLQITSGLASGGSYRLAPAPVPAQAFAAAVVSYGYVVHVNVTSNGSGYATAPSVSIVGGGGSNATVTAQVSGGAVTGITVTGTGAGYNTGTPNVEIAPPPVAAILPVTASAMRLDASILAPYHNYQIQFSPALGQPWTAWNGGLFTPTDVTNSQFPLITNGTGYFRLQYVP